MDPVRIDGSWRALLLILELVDVTPHEKGGTFNVCLNSPVVFPASDLASPEVVSNAEVSTFPRGVVAPPTAANFCHLIGLWGCVEVVMIRNNWIDNSVKGFFEYEIAMCLGGEIAPGLLLPLHTVWLKIRFTPGLAFSE